MNAKLFSLLKLILLLVIALGLLFLAFRGMDVRKILNEMFKADLGWLSFSVLLSFIALISRAFRWNLLIESVGFSVPLRKTFYALMVGYFANLAFPRLGEVTRCASLGKAGSVPFNVLLGTVIVERVIDVFSLFICLVLTAIIEFHRLGTFLQDKIFNPVLDKLKLVVSSPVYIFLLVSVLAFFSWLIFYLRRRSGEEKKESKLVRLFRGLVDGLRSIGKLKRPWLFVFHSVFIWLLYYFSVYVCFFALPYTSGLGFGAALFLLVAGGIGMSAPVQGGIGAYHLLVSGGLVLYGLSQQDALTFATLVHSSQILMVVVLGAISLLALFLEKRKADKIIQPADMKIEV